MRVCIDLRPLETGNRFRGFGYYIENLIAEMLKIDQSNHYILLVHSRRNPLSGNKNPHVSYELVKPANIHPRLRWISDQLALGRLVKQLQPNIFISLDMNLPLGLVFQRQIKTVVAIHDLIPLLFYRKYRYPLDRWGEYKIKYWTASKASQIITISQYSKGDIIKYLGVDPHRISVIYEAVTTDFKPLGVRERKKVRDQFSAGQPYFLLVGDYYGIDPRKDYPLAVSAFAELTRTQKYANYRLIFAGKCGGADNEYQRINQQAKQLGIENKIIFTGFVPQSDLARLFGAAHIFCHPSRYEGFGLPILQAQACGTPVVAARNSSIPEVAGKGAALFKTRLVSELIKAIKQVEQNRAKYVQAGFKNCRRFCWREAAHRTISVLS